MTAHDLIQALSALPSGAKVITQDGMDPSDLGEVYQVERCHLKPDSEVAIRLIADCSCIQTYD